MKKILAIIGLVFLLAACSVQPAPSTSKSLEASAGSWQPVGSTVAINIDGFPVLTQTNTGIPVVAYAAYNGSSRNIYVKRWNGTSWVQLGTSVNINPGQDAYYHSLALNSFGNPVVSWSESDGNSFNIYVKRWNGSSWVQLGSSLDVNTNQHAYVSSLALDSFGNPVVSWEEEGFGHNIYVKHWNGSSWVQLGTALDVITYLPASSPSLALDSSGNPVVSWVEGYGGSNSNNIYVKRWNGSSWVQLGGILDVHTNQFAYDPSLALDNFGNPVVSWEEYDGTSNNVYVKRWNGSSWVQLGSSLDVNTNQPAYTPSLALNSSGNPVVSWYESDGTSWNVYVKQWNGSSWVNVGTVTLDNNRANSASFPSLSLVNGNLMVGWNEFNGTSQSIYVKKYVTPTPTDPWTFLGDSVLSTSSSTISVGTALRGNDRPVVAWSSFSTDPTKATLRLREWNGTSWASLGSLGNLPTTGFAMATRSKENSTDMTIDPIGFAWKTQNGTNSSILVKMKAGSTWTNLPALAVSNVTTFSLALDKSGLPILARMEQSYIAPSTIYKLYVHRWNGSAWTQLGATVVTQTVWIPWVSYDTFDLEIDPSNRPVVAGYGFVKRWNGSSWITLSGNGSAAYPDIAFLNGNPIIASGFPNPFNGNKDATIVKVNSWNGSDWVDWGYINITNSNYSAVAKITVDSLNRPIVTWTEGGDVFVKRWNGTAWTLFGNRLDKGLSNNVSSSNVFAKSNNQVIVSWSEAGNIYFKQR